jgi:phosphomannomutase
LRGLERELTDDMVADHVRAFVAARPTGGGLGLGRDLGASWPRMAPSGRAAGLAVANSGSVPTLALLAPATREAAAVVSGNHIQTDRNGLKFFISSAEIPKEDEAAIPAGPGGPWPESGSPAPRRHARSTVAYLCRYLAAYGPKARRGPGIGVYAHSAVGRDLPGQALSGLGAEAHAFGSSERFVAPDAEAVDEGTRARPAAWAAAGGLDAIVSTDGEGNRPLLADIAGRTVPGDILGRITAAARGNDSGVTPASSNGGAELSVRFAQVVRTRIGSP